MRFIISTFFRALKPLTFSLMICLMLLLKRKQKLEKRERLVEEGCCDQIDTCQDLVNFFLTNISFSIFCYQDLVNFFPIKIISFLSKLVNLFLVEICFFIETCHGQFLFHQNFFSIKTIANFLTAFVNSHHPSRQSINEITKTCLTSFVAISIFKKFHSTMILSSVFSLFATQVLGSIGRGFRQHGRLVAEYPWPIIVFRFENALK